MLTISWSPAVGAVKYKVSASSPGLPTSNQETTQTSVNMSLDPSKTHTVTVTGVNSAGASGPSSDPVNYTPPPLSDKVIGVTVVPA